MGKILVIAVAVAFVGMGWLIWWSGEQAEQEAVREQKALGERWGREVFSVCGASLSEQHAPVPAEARIVYFGRTDGGDGPPGVWTGNLPVKQRASGKDDVTHVACLEQSRRPDEQCRYDGGHVVARNRRRAVVRLVDLRARTVVARWVAEGGEARCPDSITRRRGETRTEVLDGPEPDLSEGLKTLSGIGRPTAASR